MFAEEARWHLSGVEFAIHEARSAAAAEDAAIRVGCVPAPIDHLHRFLIGLRAIVPGAHTVVEHAASHDQVEKLNSGEIDLAIIHDTAATVDIVTAPVFAGQPLVALLPAAHRAAALPAVSPNDLAGEPLLAFPGDASATLHGWIRRVAASAGYRLSKVIEGGGADPRNAALAVAEGTGVALVPATVPPGRGAHRRSASAPAGHRDAGHHPRMAADLRACCGRAGACRGLAGDLHRTTRDQDGRSRGHAPIRYWTPGRSPAHGAHGK